MELDQLQSLAGVQLFPQSLQHVGTETLCFAKDGTQHYLLIGFDPQVPSFVRDTFSGEVQDFDLNTAIKWCLPSHSNARKLRRLFLWTAPQPLGLKTTFGAGDRLGLAAAAHIQAARGCRVCLVLAQQSMREMTRTQRTPEDVLDAATWGAFRENFQQPWGADADHLKSADDVRRLAAAGFTFFTIDPSEYVDDNVLSYDEAELKSRFKALPDAAAFAQLYARIEVPRDGEPLVIDFNRATLQRAALKFARAIEHTVKLAKLLDQLKGKGGYDLEMSVDESGTPTSVEEHFFIANELKRQDVQVQSLAIRFVGEFQKGIDYLGDSAEFAARLRDHAAIARTMGPYKISVHSGSDKYSIYPIIGQVCGELLHVKTAGTWYLEALRTVARCDAALFREILDFAAARFGAERATYHVVENLDDLPDYRNLPDAQLESLFSNNTARQMLHVTFGSVLSDKTEAGAWRFRPRLYQLLLRHEETHLDMVRFYARRHLQSLGLCDN